MNLPSKEKIRNAVERTIRTALANMNLYTHATGQGFNFKPDEHGQVTIPVSSPDGTVKSTYRFVIFVKTDKGGH